MILDYNQCEEELNKLNKDVIKEVNPIGYSSVLKLPIRQFTLGTGKNHVIVSGSQHSNEIISTSFVIMLMKYLQENNISFDNITIHFIPILNPDGYIINTSAIRKLIPENECEDNVIKFCYKYYQEYKLDTILKYEKDKRHQMLFKDIDEKCLDSKYNVLKDAISSIISSQPNGSIIDWAANGNGIDLNSNSINRKVLENEYNKHYALNNIRIDIPSPIGYPGKNYDTNFRQEKEIEALNELFQSLSINDNKVIGYFNYHSIGGMIFQRPENDNIFFKNYNYMLAKNYQEFTKNNNGKYKILTDKSGKITSVNDTLRITYPGNLLIELSPMMGNPIGVYGDKQNFNNTIDCNIQSFVYTLSNMLSLYNESYHENDIQYEELDNIYETKKKTLNK